MVLTIDIGNTTIGIGVFSGDALFLYEKIASTEPFSDCDYIDRLNTLLVTNSLTAKDIEGSIISSVVPRLTSIFQSVLEHLTDKPVLILSHKMKLPLELTMDSPDKVGCDRIADTVGAAHQYPLPLITIDMGTATTLNVVDSHRHFRGGIIMPGVGTANHALLGKAALLSAGDIAMPAHTIGRSTRECISSGMIYGNACALDGLIRRIESELGCPCTVVATGGYADTIVPHCQADIIIDNSLLMKGLKILFDLNK